MSANAGFGFDVNLERPKFSSRFGAKQNPNAPKRIPLGDITERNEIGYNQLPFAVQNHPFQQQKPQIQTQPQFFHQQDRRFDNDPVEHMYPPDPPQEYQGFKFTPSNEPCFDDDIELEPLIIHREVQWF